MHEGRKTTAAGEHALPACLTTMRDDDRSGEAFPWEEMLLARLKVAREGLDRERAEAPGLCAELLALAPETRAGRIVDEVRFRTWGVCEELLLLSSLDQDPARAGHLASLALGAADGLAEIHQPPLVNDLMARAWSRLGTARLQTGDLAGAEEALRAGALRLEEGTGDLLVDAVLLEFEAAVREARGELREAASLLRQAEIRYKEVGETVFSARAARTRERVRRALNPE